MSFTSRLSTRVLVVAAVVGLTASLAGQAVAQDESQDATTDELHGVAAPGLTVSRVSGEAFGAEAEIVEHLEFTDGSEVSASSIDHQALLDAVRTHDFNALNDALKAAGVEVTGGVGAAATIFDIRGEAGPDPEVELPETGGGPIKDTEDEFNLKFHGTENGSATLAKDLSVVTEGWPGDTGWSRSEAKAHEVSGFILDADKVESECSADLSGVKASTEIEEGKYSDENSDNLDAPKHPDPNEELVDFEDESHGFFLDGSPGTAQIIFSLVVNKQDKDDHAITVTGAVEEYRIVEFHDADPSHPVFDIHFEMSTAQSHCDIHPDPVVQVVEPKFTG